MFKRKAGKFIAILICITMFFSCACINSYATEDKPIYLLMGDSIALGSGLENSLRACYGKIVADTNGYDYKNYAFDGVTSQDLLFEVQYYKDVVKEADIINISVGGNDFLFQDGKFVSEGTIRLVADAMIKGDYTAIDSVIENFNRNFKYIIKTIKNFNPDAVILVQTLYNPQRGQLKKTYQYAVDGINDAIRRYDNENPEAIVIVDVAEKLGNNRKYFATDTIHPSVIGNEKIAVIVLEKLKEIGLGTQTEPVIIEKGIDTEMPVPVGLIIELLATAFNIASVFYGIYDTVVGIFN